MGIIDDMNMAALEFDVKAAQEVLNKRGEQHVHGGLAGTAFGREERDYFHTFARLVFRSKGK